MDRRVTNSSISRYVDLVMHVRCFFWLAVISPYHIALVCPVRLTNEEKAKVKPPRTPSVFASSYAILVLVA